MRRRTKYCCRDLIQLPRFGPLPRRGYVALLGVREWSMADGQGKAPPSDPQALARDWITIWQSEFSALATDREMQEGWVRLIELWAQAATTAAALLPGALPHDSTDRRAGPAAPAGPAAALAAPDARDATIQRLADRVAELERRLAGLVPPINPGGSVSGA